MIVSTIPSTTNLIEFLGERRMALLKCIAPTHLTRHSDLQKKPEVVLKGAQLYVHCHAGAMANTTANRC